MAKRWYVVQTKIKQETLAVQQLRQQRFDLFFPTFIKPVRDRKTGKIIKKILPLFPSYLFVQFDIKRNKRWQSILNTRGVQSLVGCTERYVSPVPKGCVEEILLKRDPKGHILIVDCIEKMAEFLPNQQLKIRGETYENIIATYCNHSENRVNVLLSLLGRPVRVSLALDDVQPLSHTEAERR